MRNRPARTLRTTVRRNLLKAAALGALVACWAGGSALGEAVSIPENAVDPEVLSQFTRGTPAELVARHDCWSGPAPADMEGKMPGHVVVTLPDGEIRYGGSHLVGKALDQIFSDAEYGLTVHGFCR